MKPHKQRLSSMSNQRKTENPTGAGKKPALRMTFDSRLKLEFHGSNVTSDAGLLAYRELDAALGLTDLGENLLNDWRTGKNRQHSMVALMRGVTNSLSLTNPAGNLFFRLTHRDFSDQKNSTHYEKNSAHCFHHGG